MTLAKTPFLKFFNVLYWSLIVNVEAIFISCNISLLPSTRILAGFGSKRATTGLACESVMASILSIDLKLKPKDVSYNCMPGLWYFLLLASNDNISMASKGLSVGKTYLCTPFVSSTNTSFSVSNKSGSLNSSVTMFDI